LDAYKAEEAEKAKAQRAYMVGTPIEQPTVEQKTDEVKPATKELYGNKDKKKQFNISPLIPSLKGLPDDKFIMIGLKYHKNADGTLVEDASGRRAQIVAPGDYQNSTQPITKGASDNFYDVIYGKPGDGGGYVVVHEPTKVEQ